MTQGHLPARPVADAVRAAMSHGRSHPLHQAWFHRRAVESDDARDAAHDASADCIWNPAPFTPDGLMEAAASEPVDMVRAAHGSYPLPRAAQGSAYAL